MVKRLPRVDRIKHRVHLLFSEIVCPVCSPVGGVVVVRGAVCVLHSGFVSVVVDNDGTACCGVLWGCERP